MSCVRMFPLKKYFNIAVPPPTRAFPAFAASNFTVLVEEEGISIGCELRNTPMASESKFSRFTAPDELLAVVNERDEEIGGERRDVIHARNLLHRAVHVLVFCNTGKLLVQQRSIHKDTFPLHWECVGGHLSPGESYEAAAVRELEEELGIRATDVAPLCKLNAGAETGFEFIQVYRARIDAACELRPNEEEIVATRWLHTVALADELRALPGPVSPMLMNTVRAVGLLLIGH